MAGRERCRGREGGVGCAHVGDRAATFVVFGRVGGGHVVEDYGDVFLAT